MIAKTKRKTRLSMQNFTTMANFEIVNPIESKSLFGGDLYSPTLFNSTQNTAFTVNDPGFTMTSSGHWWANSGPTGPAYNGGIGGGYSNPYDYNHQGSDNGYNIGVTNGGYGSWYNANGFPDIDKVLTNLPQNVPVQGYGGSCVMTSASFVASFYGSNQSPEFMMHEYALAHNMNVLQEGLALLQGLGHDQQVSFLMQQFYIEGVRTITDMTDAIDRGHPVMSVIMTGPNSGHEVTIVGYDSHYQQFTVANTIYGGYSYVPYTDMDLTLMSWEITGVKP